MRRRPPRARPSTVEPRERLAIAVLGALVVGSALALGSIHTEVLAVCAVAAVAAAVLASPQWAGRAPSASATVIAYVIIGLTAWTALQLMPMPIRVLEAIAGENADIWRRSLLPLKESGPALAPLTVDPIATRVHVLRGLIYLTTFAASLPIAASRTGRTHLQRIVIIATAAMAAAAVAHPALSIHRIFLVYEPKETYSYDPAHLAPLLNTNHLAAYVNIGALLSLAAIFERGDNRVLPRPVAVVLALLLGALTVWTGSRGGFATLLIGSILVTLLSLRRQRRERAATATALGVIAAAAVFLLSAFDITRTKLTQNNLSKLSLAKKGFELLADYGIFGSGRGTFESVFPKIREGTDYVVFTHPENVVVQWTTEWGVPVAVTAMVALGWALRPQRALTGDHPPIGPWAAIVAVSAHNLVDFSGEIPGVVIALTVCAAIVTGRDASTIGDDEPAPLRWRRRLAIGAVASIGVFVALTVWNADLELHDEQRSFTALAIDRSLSRDTFHARARSALLRHPAEPYFPFVGAVRAAAARDESVLPWAARALERSPIYGRVHLLLGRALQPRNPAQARLEYRIACAQDNLTCAVPEVLPIVRSFEEALELVPEDAERGPLVLEFLINGLAARLPSTATRLEHELRSRSNSSLEPVRRAALNAASDLANDESWCSNELRDACIREGAQAAQVLVTVAPHLCDGYALTATFQREAGDPHGAFDQFDAAVPLADVPSTCAYRLLDFARATQEKPLVDRAIARIENLSCGSPEECANNQLVAARAEAQRGNPKRALVLMQKAWEINENDQLLYEIGENAEAQGMHAQAVDAYLKLAARHPEEPKWRERLERARAAAAAKRFEAPRPP